jgi:signal transduction histidine kinase
MEKKPSPGSIEMGTGIEDFNRLFAQAPVAVCIVSGPDYKVEMVNDSMLEILGRTRDVIGNPIEKSLTEARKQGLIALLDTVRQTNQPLYVSNFPASILINGVMEMRHFSLIFKPYYLNPGDEHAAAIFCVAHNITDQVFSLQKLEAEKQLTTLALEVGEVGMVETDWEKGIIKTDPRADEIFDSHGSMTIEEYLSRIHPDDRAIRDKALEEGKKTGMFDFEVRLVLHHKDIRWLKSRGVFQKNREGEIVSSFGVVQDITAQKEFAQALHQKVEERTKELEEANQSLRDVNAELARSNKNLEEFAYAASHDLKEPIRKILLFSDRLKKAIKGKLENDEEFLLNRMEQAALRMGVLVDDLLVYSYVNRASSVFYEPVDLNAKIAAILDDLELLITEKKAVIKVVGPLPTIKGNRRQFQQLFQNLISNGLKYHKPGETPVIEISCSVVQGADLPVNFQARVPTKPYYLIKLRDNGIGFEKDEAERIFDVFTRLHGNAEYPGTGVGLSIARKVAENHGGYLWAYSEPGKGATFYVALKAD